MSSNPIEVLRELRADIANERELGHNAADRERAKRLRSIDAAIASLSAQQSGNAESKLADAGVFAGHHGLRGLADADEFWGQQPYGTRLYYGDGGMDYLHRGVLQKAVEILDAAPQPPARMTEIPEPSSNGWLQAGGLLYRLTEGHRPQNRDEINVTMVHGSRDSAHCEARAAEILAMLQSQPAAEAQAQGGGEVAGWVLEDTFLNAKFWAADTPPQGWTPVYYTAPPSAPVGVEGLPPDVQEIVRKDDAAWALAERAEAAGAERDSDDDGTWWTLRIEHFKALAQPSAPDSDKAMKWHAWRLTRLRDQLRSGLRPDELKAFEAALAALARQPAAVDEAMEFVRDIAQQKPEKPDHWSSCSQCESNIDRAEEVLAAQQGGSDNDR